MALVSEHSKQLQELNSSMPIDNIKSIDSLPDELLIYIINFLPTKYAFITSILSRRWSCLFKEVTRLDFDDSLLFNSLSASDHGKMCVTFRDFIYKTMDCLKLSNLISFRIKFSIWCDCFKFERSVHLWLEAILSHRIQEIDLCINSPAVLPNSIFTCQTLCILKLTIRLTLSAIPDTVCLPCLKILHLDLYKVLDAHTINRIFSGCPSLEDFYMEELGWYEAERLSISVPSLKKLKLDKGNYFRFHPMAFVSVVAPFLQCFHYADKLAEHYSIKSSNYLVEAHLDTTGDFYDHVDLSAVSYSARELVQGVSNVKRLFLSAYCIEALTLLKDELPVLRNLTELKIGCSSDPHLTLLRLLRSAPNLEELTFSEGLFHDGFKDKDTVQQDYWGKGRAAPLCLKTHLKVIEIEHFLGLKEELRIVDFLLRNGHALDQLIIHKWLGSKAKFKVRKQLKRFAKRWQKCVKFNELFL